MAEEIERRFLIEDPAVARKRATRSEVVAQGYVAIDPAGLQVRVRRLGERTLLTVKGGSGEHRVEVEFDIERGVFGELWELTDGRRIEKRRHYVEAAEGLVYEVDVYDGDLSGLAVVEVEFGSGEESAAFEPPDWFGAELTGDERYSNVSLAVDGLPAERP